MILGSVIGWARGEEPVEPCYSIWVFYRTKESVNDEHHRNQHAHHGLIVDGGYLEGRKLGRIDSHGADGR